MYTSNEPTNYREKKRKGQDSVWPLRSCAYHQLILHYFDIWDFCSKEFQATFHAKTFYIPESLPHHCFNFPGSFGVIIQLLWSNNIHQTPAYVWSEETLLFTEQDVVTALFIYCTFNILLGEIKNSYSRSQHPIYPYESESVPQNPFFPSFKLKDLILTHPRHFLKVNFVMT